MNADKPETTLSSTILERHITIESADVQAADILTDASGLSKNVVKQLMQRGGVWHTRQQHTQRLRRAKRALQSGDELHLYYNEHVFNQTVSPAQLIADEGGYSVWCKPCGMLSQGSKWGDHTSITRYAEQHLTPQRNAFLVHRLDRATTGLIVIAHSKKAAASLSALFEKRTIEKCYQAIVYGRWPIAKTITTLIDDKPAVSHVNILEYSEQSDQTLLEIKIDTGRKHQIRKHLSEAGYPIVGDRLYGHADKLVEKDLQLFSMKIQFICPLTHELRDYSVSEPLRLQA